MIISLQSSLGIQFGRDYLLLVHLKKFLKEIALDCHKMIQAPPDLAEEESASYCSREISRFIKENTIGKDSVWVGLPRNYFLLRFLTLPLSAEENIREVVRFELGKYIPFSEEDVYFDFVTMKRDAEAKKIRLLLLVIKKSVLERYLSILRRAGVTPLGIEMSSSSLFNLFWLGENGNNSKAPVALLDIGKQSFEFNLVRGKSLCYSRVVDFDSKAEKDQAQQIKKEVRTGFRAAFCFQGGKVEEEMNSSRVSLTGGGVNDDLIAHLSKTLKMNLETLPTEAIASRLNLSESFPLSFASGIGLALRGIKRVPWNINLLPQPLRKKTRKIGLYLSFFLVFTVLVLSLAWGLSTVLKERLELRNIEREIAALKNEVISIQTIQQETQKISEKMESLKMMRKSEFSMLEILKELSNILPYSVWLTNFRYYKKELELSGYAASASDLIAILDGSPLFYASEFTAPITRDRKGQERFKIKTNLEKR